MDELFKNNAYKILEVFIKNSHKDFQARQIARLVKISHGTVLKYLKELKDLELINENKETLYKSFRANSENENFKKYKRDKIISDIINSGLIEHIYKETYSHSIILFGSCAKGEFTQQSDIDIFVESQEAKIALTKFEKILKKSINILFESNIRNLSDGLRNNIINGTILQGFIKLNK